MIELQSYEQLEQLAADNANAVVPALGKFEGCEDARLAELLYAASVEGWCDDQRGSSTDGPLWVGLIGRFIVSEDSQGFFAYEVHDSEITARQVFRRIEVES